jgi:hypothetical protein
MYVPMQIFVKARGGVESPSETKLGRNAVVETPERVIWNYLNLPNISLVMQSGVPTCFQTTEHCSRGNRRSLLILGVSPRAGSTIKDIDFVVIGPSRDAFLLRLVFGLFQPRGVASTWQGCG